MDATEPTVPPCVICEQPAVRRLSFPDTATGQHRPKVDVCPTHGQLTDSGAWTPGWCSTSLHPGARNTTCATHGTWFA